MYFTFAKALQSAALQVCLHFQDFTRIKASRLWWEIPYTKLSDLSPPLQELYSIFEQTVHNEIVERASKDGLNIIPDGLSVLWVEDAVFTKKNITALIWLSPPEVTISKLQSLSIDDTWKNSILAQLFRTLEDQTETAISASEVSSVLETSQTSAVVQVETLTQQLRLVARTRDKTTNGIDVTSNVGGVCVLERNNGLEMEGGGAALMLIRYRVKQ